MSCYAASVIDKQFPGLLATAALRGWWGMVISERLGMSVSCWVVGVSRVLPSVAKHHCFAPMVRFPWVVGGPVHP